MGSAVLARGECRWLLGMAQPHQSSKFYDKAREQNRKAWSGRRRPATTQSCQSLRRRKMAIRLTLDIFSGRLNPQIVLTDDQEREVLNRMRPRKERLTRKELVPAPLSILGYRGIVVEQLDRPSRGLPRSFRVVNGDLIGDDFRDRASNENVELFLSGTSGPFQVLDLGPEFPDPALKHIHPYHQLPNPPTDSHTHSHHT